VRPNPSFELTRYVVAGGSAIIAFGSFQPVPFLFIKSDGEISTWLMLLFILTVGPAVYSVHKAILHPLFLIFIFLGIKGRRYRLKSQHVGA
jgi:hypothetical protein